MLEFGLTPDSRNLSGDWRYDNWRDLMDLERFATKKDLELFATKQELVEEIDGTKRHFEALIEVIRDDIRVSPSVWQR